MLSLGIPHPNPIRLLNQKVLDKEVLLLSSTSTMVLVTIS